MLIGVVHSSHKAEAGEFPSFNLSDMRTASHAKARPGFSLIFPINAQGVVCRRGTFIVPFITALVSADTGVDYYALAVQRKLVTEYIAMTMARLIIGPKRATVKNQAASRSRVPNHRIPRFLQNAHFRASDCRYLDRSEEHTSELQSRFDLVCRRLLENKNKYT